MASAKFIYLNSRDELLRIDISKIVYIEADGNYTKIVISNNMTGVVCMNLSKMEEVISNRCSNEKVRFARIGKRFIINMGYIFRINVLKQELVLSDQSTFSYTLSVSKDALRNLKDLFVVKSSEKE